MGNTAGKGTLLPRPRNRKQHTWRGLDTSFPPGKPYLPLDTDITPDVITIRWDRPFKDGGSPITGYLVEHRRVGSPHWVRATPLLTQHPELTLSGLEPGWRYQFRVFAENMAGLSDASELSEPLTVTLQRSAITAPKFTQELKPEFVVLENEKVEFVVYFLGQPAPKMCWFKDGFEIFSSRRTRILTEADRSVLTIYQSAICDEGEIKCTATNKAGHASTKTLLKLESPPNIRLPRQYEEGLLFEIGEVMRLKVSVAGLPAPLVFWCHNGESMQDGKDRFSIETTDQSSTLRISEARRSDRGEYQIKAVNRLGNDITSFLVTITDKPSPPGKARVVMTLGKSVTLSWNTPSDDGGCKIGSYIVEYYRIGWNVWLKAATSRQLSTLLGNLIEGSEYKFRVKAESPYGVSEPSEESDVVFIPDSKRGILQPSARSRSQPREIEEILSPVATKRKHKAAPRSHSNPRTLEEDSEDDEKLIPTKPERLKLNSPTPKSPKELSPLPEKKPLIQKVLPSSKINKDIFDRSSLARELSYGSPELKLKRSDDLDLEINQTVNKEKEFPVYTPSKLLQDSIRNNQIIVEREKSASPIQNVTVTDVINEQEKLPIATLAPNDTLKRNKFSRENSENMGGSSEYMLVLFPEEHKGYDDRQFDFSSSVAPPLSLSAPELGSDFPVPEMLRLSASSTELLHERALVRFYQEALAEEDALKRRREARDDKSPIPKIQINNQDEDESLIGLERKHSLRRKLSAGGQVPQQILWTQRRHSLRNSGEFTEADGRIHKFPATVEEKRQIMANRQRSESEEKEEEEFERIRLKMGDTPTKKKKISVVQEDIWAEEEAEEDEEVDPDELSVSDSGSSIDSRFMADKRVVVPQVDHDEEETYNPRMRSFTQVPQEIQSPTKSKISDEPFEILTKPTKLPDPNFVPKPILKKRDPDERKSSSSDVEHSNTVTSSRSSSLTDDSIVPTKSTQMKSNLEDALQSKDISAIASISGIAAIGPIVAQPFLKKQSEDEQKVLIDHYGDIVKSYSTHRKPSVTTSSLLDKYAKGGTDEKILEPEVVPEKVKEVPTVKEVPPVATSQFSRFDERFKTIESKINGNHLAQQIIESPKVLEESVRPQLTPQTRDTSTEVPLAVRDSRSAVQTGRLESREPRRPRKASPSPMRSTTRNTSLSRNLPTQLPSNIMTQGIGMQSTVSPIQMRREITTPSILQKKEIATQSRSTSKTRSRSNTRSKPSSRSNSSTQTIDNSLRQSQNNLVPTSGMRKPRMCEIMTQTSTCIDPFPSIKASSTISTTTSSDIDESAVITVRTTMDYITDLAMFAVACWLFLFSNELLAIPVLGIMVFRQLKEEMKRRMPQWLRKRLLKKEIG